MRPLVSRFHELLGVEDLEHVDIFSGLRTRKQALFVARLDFVGVDEIEREVRVVETSKNIVACAADCSEAKNTCVAEAIVLGDDRIFSFVFVN